MIAFYGSVRSYGQLFEVCGFAAEARRIQEAFQARDVEAMVGAVTDAMIDEFAVAGSPEQVRAGLRRFDGLADEVVLTVPSFRIGPERVAEILTALTEHCAPAAR